MSRWNHLMCAACWNADERHVNKAVEGSNSEAQQCCWCQKPTTSGIWVREDPEKLPCKHCSFPKCDELAPIGIQDLWLCFEHVDWGMAEAFKPGRALEKALKGCENDADA